MSSIAIKDTRLIAVIGMYVADMMVLSPTVSDKGVSLVWIFSHSLINGLALASCQSMTPN